MLRFLSILSLNFFRRFKNSMKVHNYIEIEINIFLNIDLLDEKAHDIKQKYRIKVDSNIKFFSICSLRTFDNN